MNSKEELVVKLHHVSLIIDDLEVALSFYENILGLKCDASRPELGYPGAWLGLPEQQQIHLMVLENPDSNRVFPEHGGRDRHVAFNVSSVDKIAQSLEQAGISFTKSKSGRKALFCRDPDGNALEFIDVH